MNKEEHLDTSVSHGNVDHILQISLSDLFHDCHQWCLVELGFSFFLPVIRILCWTCPLPEVYLMCKLAAFLWLIGCHYTFYNFSFFYTSGSGFDQI